MLVDDASELEVQKIWKFRKSGSSENLEVQKNLKFKKAGSSENLFKKTRSSKKLEALQILRAVARNGLEEDKGGKPHDFFPRPLKLALVTCVLAGGDI
jgi:hypothetical protein